MGTKKRLAWSYNDDPDKPKTIGIKSQQYTANRVEEWREALAANPPKKFP